VTLDPGFVNTASTTSAITFLDGEQGILRYRGYPIEQLAEQSNFIEVGVPAHLRRAAHAASSSSASARPSPVTRCCTRT
jgi:citrate synthase